METDYQKRTSRYLNGEIEYKCYGKGGQLMVVFPDAGQRFYSWEDSGLCSALDPWLESGRLRLVCVDSYGAEAWQRSGLSPRERGERLERWHLFLSRELCPQLQSDRRQAPPYLTAGIGLGAVQAVALCLREPALFAGGIALSGCYETVPTYFDDAADDLVFRNSIPSMLAARPARPAPAGNAPLYLCAGQAPAEQAALASMRSLAAALEQAGIPAAADAWGGDVDGSLFWRLRQLPYFTEKLIGPANA